ATGDQVLREIAGRLSDSLGAFEPVYRLGGEEFLVLLPGRDESASRTVAERLWRAVRAKPIADVPVTMSFGVASSAPGGGFDFDAAFARADGALYMAKQAGRDLIRVAPREAGAATGALGSPAMGPAMPHRDPSNLPAGPTERERGPGGPIGAGSRTEGPWTAPDEPEPDQMKPGRRWMFDTAGSLGGGEAVMEDLEVEHVVDLNRRLRVLFRGIALGAFVMIATAIPRFGWHPLIAPVVGAVAFYLLSRNATRFRRPTRALGAGWILFQTSIAVGFASAHGAPLFALPLLSLMVPGRCAVLRTRAAAAGTAYTAFLMAAAALFLDASRVFGNPAIVLFPIAEVVTAGFVGATVGASAVDFRGAGIVDELTGMLNRTALGARLLELRAQPGSLPHSVAILLADLDHFKRVNDQAGHSTGDSVLREVASRIRSALRTFDSAYRVGGEEFLVLLPDASTADALAVAERLHQAVRSEPCEGQAVTVSVGVAASRPGKAFVYEDVFGRADTALYEAKQSGRDRICVDGQPVRAVDTPAEDPPGTESGHGGATETTPHGPVPPAMGSAA
ncbi:MAG: GGDEF domain-containing protein, partial [Acidobacteriota bacterium]|nr:GGDEF domain-containing protein [Acidobacteriota bacterium]